HSSRSRCCLHVPGQEKPRSLRRAQRRDRKDRDGTNQTRPGTFEKQTFPCKSREITAPPLSRFRCEMNRGGSNATPWLHLARGNSNDLERSAGARMVMR